MNKKSTKEDKSIAVKTDWETRFRELERRFEELLPDNWGISSNWDLPEWAKFSKMELKSPKVDIIDRDDDILVRADVPGVKKEDLDVSLTDNTITIRGSTSKEEKEEKGDYFRSETMKGSFSRTMSLPSDVDGEKGKTSFKEGVLEVTIPKVEKAKRVKIEVS